MKVDILRATPILFTMRVLLVTDSHGYSMDTAINLIREEVYFTLNGALWSSVKQGREKSEYFLADGLHLKTKGKKWLQGDG